MLVTNLTAVLIPGLSLMMQTRNHQGKPYPNTELILKITVTKKLQRIPLHTLLKNRERLVLCNLIKHINLIIFISCHELRSRDSFKVDPNSLWR